MNVKLRQNFELPGAVYSNDQLLMNTYYIDVEMITVDNSINDLDVAARRIDWFVETVLADAVFVDQSDTERNSILAMLGLNVVTLPGAPVDQLIGIMLTCKLNAIVEGKIEVIETSVSSRESKGLWFTHQNSQDIGPFDTSGWWHEPTLLCNNIVFDDDEVEDNVVKVAVNPWLEYDLAWRSDSTDTKESKIIVGNFSKKNEH